MSREQEAARRQGLKVTTGEYRGVPLIQLAGELDSASVRTLYPALDDALHGPATVVLLDLRDLTYVDSAGLNVLFDALRTMSRKGWMGAVAPNQVVQKLLEMGGLIHHPCFRLFEDLDSVTTD